MYITRLISKKGTPFVALCADSRSGLRTVLAVEMDTIIKFFTFEQLALLEVSPAGEKIFYERSI